VSSWRLSRRLLVASITVLVLMAVAAVVVYTSYGSLVRQQKRVTGVFFDALQSAGALSRAMLDQETGVRGYALSDEPEALAPFRDGQRAEEYEAARLRALLADEDPRLVAELDQLMADVETWREEYARPVIEQVRRDGGDSLTAAQERQGRRLFNEVRAEQDVLRSAIAQGRQDAIDDVGEARGRMLTVFGTGLVLLLVAVGAQLYFLRRWVLRPLDDLGAESLTVASGQLDHEVVVQGPPEFVALAGDVDMMRRRILDQLEEASAARRSLEDQRRVLASQTVELKRSNDELEQFAYVASHDLQEPLRKVASFTQMLQQRYEGELDERAQQYIAFAVDGAQRMQMLVNDLLSFSRVARDPLPAVDVPLDDVLEEVLVSLGATIEELDAEVTHDPLPTVRGERGLLGQVLQNLVGNALKFHRPGEPPRVHVGCREVDGEWLVSVSDDGIGVEPQFAERVFVIFQRLNRREEYAGTGIGLALCRKIVEHHGGRIWLDTDAPMSEDAHSAPRSARGATFTFSLPVAHRSPAPEQP
jgi:signal transduction histidine kinase